MTPRERVLKALSHQQPDICPWHITFTIPAREKLTAYLGTDDLERAVGNHFAKIEAVPDDGPVGDFFLFPAHFAFPLKAKTDAASAASGKEKPMQETINIEQFSKVDIRVVVVKAAEAVPKSRNLIKLVLDVGELGERTVAAGIVGYYQPEELVGKKLLLAANLEPRTVMGIESQGMILAGVHGEDLGLCTMDDKTDLPPGTKIS